MLQTFQSENNLTTTNNAQPTTGYTTMSYNDHNYRVSIQEHESYSSVLLFWSVFCISLTIMCIGVIFEDIFQKNGVIICGGALVGGLGLLTFTIIKRRYLGKIFIITSANFVALILSWLIWLALEQKSTIIPTSLISMSRSYLVVLEFILSIYHMENKSIMMGKVLILGQIFIFSLKIDNIIKSNWVMSLFILILMTAIFFIATIFVVIFTLISFYVVDGVSPQKKCGFTFIGLICFCLGINCFIPFLHFLFGLQLWIGAVIALTFNILMIIFIYSFQIGIKLFFCKTQELKTFNQNVYLTQIKSQELKKFKFSQISQNWYAKTKLKKKQRKKMYPTTSSMKNIKESTCLVCLENLPQVIWMPCGHLTVCLECCQKMFDKKNACCLLCKLLPTQVFIIQSELQIKSTDESNKNIEKQEGKQETNQVIIMKKATSLQESFNAKARVPKKNENIETFNIKQGYKIQIY